MKDPIRFDFSISHRTEDNKHFITFIPMLENKGYAPKEIEVTEQQRNDLRYHFSVGVNNMKKIEKLAYIV
jgi:hypothetical protein